MPNKLLFSSNLLRFPVARNNFMYSPISFLQHNIPRTPMALYTAQLNCKYSISAQTIKPSIIPPIQSSDVEASQTLQDVAASEKKKPISRRGRENAPVFALTDSAANRIKELLSNNPNAIGIYIGMDRKGCNGYAYTYRYALPTDSHCEKVKDKDVAIYIDPKALLFVVGTEMDYVDDEIKSQFIFNNPREKGRCGCGSSIHF